MIAPILAHFCAIGTKCKFTAKIAITKRNNHFFFGNNKKRVIFTNFRENLARPGVLPGADNPDERGWVGGERLSERGEKKSFTW